MALTRREDRGNTTAHLLSLGGEVARSVPSATGPYIATPCHCRRELTLRADALRADAYLMPSSSASDMLSMENCSVQGTPPVQFG